MRLAGPEDAVALNCFLKAHADTSMFLRGNLAAHGTQGSGHRHATEFALFEEAGDITGVVGLTRGGYLMAQVPALPNDLSKLAALWAGRTVLGMTGDAGQVPPVLAALGLTDVPVQLEADEPLYARELADLPVLDGELRAPRPDDEARLRLWFREYALDTGQSPDAPDAAEAADTRAAQVVAEPGAVRLLIERGLPVAMTGFNAVLPDMVQVGGVYVPRDRRNQGYARRAVGLHLLEARAAGVRRAILFAASAPAARAYEGLGFIRVGTYRVCLFATPHRIGAPLA